MNNVIENLKEKVKELMRKREKELELIRNDIKEMLSDTDSNNQEN